GRYSCRSRRRARRWGDGGDRRLRDDRRRRPARRPGKERLRHRGGRRRHRHRRRRVLRAGVAGEQIDHGDGDEDDGGAEADHRELAPPAGLLGLRRRGDDQDVVVRHFIGRRRARLVPDREGLLVMVGGGPSSPGPGRSRRSRGSRGSRFHRRCLSWFGGRIRPALTQVHLGIDGEHALELGLVIVGQRFAFVPGRSVLGRRCFVGLGLFRFRVFLLGRFCRLGLLFLRGGWLLGGFFGRRLLRGGWLLFRGYAVGLVLAGCGWAHRMGGEELLEGVGIAGLVIGQNVTAVIVPLGRVQAGEVLDEHRGGVV